MPTALVTGATGFVGSHLVDLLLERGWDVSITVRRSSNLRWLEGKRVERVEGDLRRPVTLPKCDVVFHVAGVIQANSWADYLAGNRDASIHAMEGSRCRRFVHVSSLAVTGPGVVATEETPCSPISMYGKSKWEGEQAVWERRDRIPVTIIRPPVVYGPRDMGLYDLFRAVATGIRPEIGSGMEISIVHVRDLVEGILGAGESRRGANEVFFISNDSPRKVSDIMSLIQESIGKRAIRIPLPDRVVRFLGGVAEDAAKWMGRRSMFNRDKALEMTQKGWVCRPDKARERLGWEAQVPLKRGMRETAAWYLEHGFL